MYKAEKSESYGVADNHFGNCKADYNNAQNCGVDVKDLELIGLHQPLNQLDCKKTDNCGNDKADKTVDKADAHLGRSKTVFNLDQTAAKNCGNAQDEGVAYCLVSF